MGASIVFFYARKADTSKARIKSSLIVTRKCTFTGWVNGSPKRFVILCYVFVTIYAMTTKIPPSYDLYELWTLTHPGTIIQYRIPHYTVYFAQ